MDMDAGDVEEMLFKAQNTPPEDAQAFVNEINRLLEEGDFAFAADADYEAELYVGPEGDVCVRMPNLERAGPLRGYSLTVIERVDPPSSAADLDVPSVG